MADSLSASFIQPGQAAPFVPPVDSPIVWSRIAPAEKPVGYTHSVRTIVSESHEQNSYAWPDLLVIHATDHPDATMNSSQSCGRYTFAYNNGSGSQWLAGSHIEVHHGEDMRGNVNAKAAGCTIGQNIEFTRKSPDGTMIGIELNAGSSPLAPDIAINVGGKYKTGIKMNGNAIELANGIVIDQRGVHRNGKLVVKF